VPHVTVARARRRVAAPAAFAALAPALDFAPEGLVLFESQLTAAERRYEPLAQAPFARE
jgi:2'-5' RNA ligase